MKMVIKFDMNNAAFGDERETVRILREIVQRIEDGKNEGAIMDINENKIGYYGVEE